MHLSCRSNTISLYWKQPSTPVEPCEWLNKMLTNVWANFMEPKLVRKLLASVQVCVSSLDYLKRYSMAIAIESESLCPCCFLQLVECTFSELQYVFICTSGFELLISRAHRCGSRILSAYFFLSFPANVSVRLF